MRRYARLLQDVECDLPPVAVISKNDCATGKLKRGMVFPVVADKNTDGKVLLEATGHGKAFTVDLGTVEFVNESGVRCW